MTKITQRIILGSGKEHLHSARPQYRFIVFLIFTLAAYTLLLRVFQKLAEILRLPVFLPISLGALLVFIALVGILYSHKFVGPMVRIRRALDQMASGETTVLLRLRESDDPMLKDLVASIGRLCEQNRNTRILLQDQSRDLFTAIEALREAGKKHASVVTIGHCSDELQKKYDLLDQTIKSFGKA